METREKDVANLEIEKQKLKVGDMAPAPTRAAARGAVGLQLRCAVPLRAPMHKRSELHIPRSASGAALEYPLRVPLRSP